MGIILGTSGRCLTLSLRVDAELGGASHILVQNFFEELKRLVPN